MNNDGPLIMWLKLRLLICHMNMHVHHKFSSANTHTHTHTQHTPIKDLIDKLTFSMNETQPLSPPLQQCSMNSKMKWPWWQDCKLRISLSSPRRPDKCHCCVQSSNSENQSSPCGVAPTSSICNQPPATLLIAQDPFYCNAGYNCHHWTRPSFWMWMSFPNSALSSIYLFFYFQWLFLIIIITAVSTRLCTIQMFYYFLSASLDFFPNSLLKVQFQSSQQSLSACSECGPPGIFYFFLQLIVLRSPWIGHLKYASIWYKIRSSIYLGSNKSKQRK